MQSFLPPVGAANPVVLIVSDFPEKIEARTRAPFSGIAHKALRAAVHSASLPLNICQYRYLCTSPYILPEQLALKVKASGPYQMTEMGLAVQATLREAIEQLHPRLIVCAGPVSLFAITGRWGIDKWRGSLLKPLWNEEGDQWVMPVLPGGRTMMAGTHAKHLIVMDIRKAVAFLDGGGKLKERTLHIDPDFKQACEFLDYVHGEGLAGKIAYFDIECKNLELDCIGFSVDDSEAMCVPLMNELGNYYTVEHEMVLMRKIGALLESKTIRKCGQNIIFDTHFMLRKYGLRITGLDDTMIAQHTIMHEFKKGLDMITSLYTDIPYYKDDGKAWFKGMGTYEKLWKYNCYDVLSCAEAFPKQMKELITRGQLETYERQRSIIEPCTYMMERGIHANMNKIEGEVLAYTRKIEPLRTEFSALAPDINPQSPKQLQTLFYQTRGYAKIKSKKGDVTTDVLAMKKLSAQGCREAALILQIRKMEKVLSTYFNKEKFDTDERIRCQYKPVGTAYSRLASSESIFETGMNMQNWPHHALSCLEPDPGYIFYAFDLSQAENRLVAYVGKITSMIEAFESGQDVHRLTAGLIFQKSPEDVSDEPGSSTIGGGVYSERDWGKRANHGLNYGFGAKAFSIMYEIPQVEALRIYNGYHTAYPGVIRGFHAYVKESLRATRTVTNLMGRVSLFLANLDDETFQGAYACIPQGTVGDLINERGMAYIYYNPQLFAPLELLIQVHDSIGFQIPLSVPWIEHAHMLQLIKESLEQPLTTHYGKQFVIPADLAMSLTLQKESGLEIKAKKWPSSVAELATQLEANHQKLSGVS